MHIYHNNGNVKSKRELRAEEIFEKRVRRAIKKRLVEIRGSQTLNALVGISRIGEDPNFVTGATATRWVPSPRELFAHAEAIGRELADEIDSVPARKYRPLDLVAALTISFYKIGVDSSAPPPPGPQIFYATRVMFDLSKLPRLV